MKFAFGSLTSRILAAATLIVLGVSCRTTSTSKGKDEAAETKEIPGFPLADWNKYCEDELANPKSGAKSRALLLRIAKTDDCTQAYRKVQQALDIIAKQGSSAPHA